jgi:ABC-type transporter Mla subunit MlaD
LLVSQDADQGTDPRHSRPRWVTISAVVAVLLALLFLVLLLAGGSHGPGRHMSSADTGSAGLIGAPAVVQTAGIGADGVRA